MRRKVAVALGSNQGDRAGHLRTAIHGLGQLGEVVAVSSLYDTAPVGGPDQDRYLNAVAVVETALEPLELLDRLAGLETAAGREGGQRGEPRPLDLDIVCIDGPVSMKGERLTLPHPRAAERRFVVEPLAEVWPSALVGEGSSARSRLVAVATQDVERVRGAWVEDREEIAFYLVAGQMVLLGTWAVLLVTGGRVPRSSTVAAVGGTVIAGAGAALAGSAAVSLGPALTPSPLPRPGAPLALKGPYRWVRHPIYLGLVLATAGVAVTFASGPAVAVSAALAAYLGQKARYEEGRLRIAHPGYAAYARRTGRLTPRRRR